MITVPSIKLQAWRKPMIAPVATNRSEPSKESVRSWRRRYLPIRHQPSIHSPGSHCPGRHGHWIHESHGLPVTFAQPNPLCPHSVTLIHAAFESRNQVMIAPSSTPSPSDFACLAAVPPPS